jgi:hypothetical protein
MFAAVRKKLGAFVSLGKRFASLLASVRSELSAHAASCMEEDDQIAELERMRLKEVPEKDV